jgi:hypothetical protein
VVEQRKNSIRDTKLNEINRKLNVFLKHLQMKRSDYMATLPFTLYSLLLERSDYIATSPFTPGREATHSMEQNHKLEE